MDRRAIEAVLWTGTLLATAAGAVGWYRGTPAPAGNTAAPITRAPVPLRAHASNIAEAAERVVRRNPFRLSRQPARIEVDSLAAEPAMPLRPALVVSGILGGPPWEAILEGVPGRRGGTVVRAGDVLGDLRVVAVRYDTVIVQGSDTTWILTLRQR
jgi:hypothetical protein